MTSVQRSLVFLLAVANTGLLAGCTFNAQDPQVFRCTAADPACPSGTTCDTVAGNCVNQQAADSRADQPRAGDQRAEAARDSRRDAAPPDRPTMHDAPPPDVPKPDTLRPDALRPDTRPSDTLRPDVSGPDLWKSCGDKVKNGSDECDGSDLGGATCETFGYNGGTLSCNGQCKYVFNACCPAPVPPPGLNPTSIVSAGKGNNATGDPLCKPFKTISAALAKAGPGQVIWVAPGIYDATLGEVFPLKLPDNVQLVGDEAHKGMGGMTTAIVGSGKTPSTYVASIYNAGLNGGGSIRGFLFNDPTPGSYGIDHAGHPMSIVANTFYGANGVNNGASLNGGAAGCPAIRDNTFRNMERGIYNQCGGNSLLVESNKFTGSGIAIYITQGNGTVRKNEFASGIVAIDSAAPILEANVFASPSAYSQGAIQLWGASPVVRGCTFKNGPAIYIDDPTHSTSTPDLGTIAQPGGNNFAGLSGVVIDHRSSTTIAAVGNNWRQLPPCPYIKLAGGGKVFWGSGAMDFCQ